MTASVVQNTRLCLHCNFAVFHFTSISLCTDSVNMSIHNFIGVYCLPQYIFKEFLCYKIQKKKLGKKNLISILSYFDRVASSVIFTPLIKSHKCGFILIQRFFTQFVIAEKYSSLLVAWCFFFFSFKKTRTSYQKLRQIPHNYNSIWYLKAITYTHYIKI